MTTGLVTMLVGFFTVVLAAVMAAWRGSLVWVVIDLAILVVIGIAHVVVVNRHFGEPEPAREKVTLSELKARAA